MLVQQRGDTADLASTALRRASVGCAVNTGWNSKRPSSSAVRSGPTSSNRWPYATTSSFDVSTADSIDTLRSNSRSVSTR